MEELGELKEFNKDLRSLKISIDRIEEALLGNEFNDNGLVKRIKTIENKLKKLDAAFYILLGVVTMGAYPLGLKVLPFIKDYLKA